MNKQELLHDLNWIMNTYPNVGSFESGFRTGLATAIAEIDKLDESTKVEPLVVPKGLGKWLSEQYLGEEGSLFTIIKRLDDMWVKSEFEEFITDNKKELIEVILGAREYEIEKEPLYVVKVPNADSYYYGKFESGRVYIGNAKPKRIKDIEWYHFTEKDALTKLPDVPKTQWIKLEDL